MAEKGPAFGHVDIFQTRPSSEKEWMCFIQTEGELCRLSGRTDLHGAGVL